MFAIMPEGMNGPSLGPRGRLKLMETGLAALSSDLFWDVSASSVDIQDNLRWLVERVLMRGRWEGWLLLGHHVTPDDLRDVLPRLRVPPRERHFLEVDLESRRA